MYEPGRHWQPERKVAVWKLGEAGPGAVGYYDELVASCSYPGATVSTAIDALDIDSAAGANNVRRVLIQSLNGFESSSSEGRALHMKIFIGMVKRLNEEGLVEDYRPEINLGMHNLVRMVQMQYNKGGTADPVKTSELIQMIDAADAAHCLESPTCASIKEWAKDQKAWEAEMTKFRAAAEAAKIAAAVISPQHIVRTAPTTSAPSATPKTRPAVTKPTATKQPPKKPAVRSH